MKKKKQKNRFNPKGNQYHSTSLTFEMRQPRADKGQDIT